MKGSRKRVRRELYKETVGESSRVSFGLFRRSEAEEMGEIDTTH